MNLLYKRKHFVLTLFSIALWDCPGLAGWLVAVDCHVTTLFNTIFISYCLGRLSKESRQDGHDGQWTQDSHRRCDGHGSVTVVRGTGAHLQSATESGSLVASVLVGGIVPAAASDHTAVWGHWTTGKWWWEAEVGNQCGRTDVGLTFKWHWNLRLFTENSMTCVIFLQKV